MLLLICCAYGSAAQASTGQPDASPQALLALLAIQQTQLTASDGRAGDGFGWSVAVSGDTALVSAPYASQYDGVVYVFVRAGGAWSQQAKLTNGTGGNEGFGDSVALDGDTALVGAPQSVVEGNGGVGAAYVFVRSGGGWSQQALLTADDGAEDDWFGGSVALSGDTALVRAAHHDTARGVDAGAAYVFVRSGGGWSQQAKLTAADGASGDYFGCSVALDGETAVVGAVGYDTARGIYAGAAYVFVRSGGAWSQQAQFTADDGAAYDEFGCSVALSGETALIGAPGHDATAYVFTRTGGGWSQLAKLTPADGANGDWFGRSVALSGDAALVGAWGSSTAEENHVGAAYVFVHSGGAWSQQQKLTAAAGGFGRSVALDGKTALVGAPGHDTAAYVIMLDTTAPTTTVSGVPAGWSSLPVTVTLSPSDDLSGLAATEYRLQGAASWLPYAAPFQVTAQGSSIYEYRSTDVAGNVEDARTVTVRIDDTPPDTANDADSPAYCDDVTVTLTPVDDLSGVAETSYSLDGGPWRIGTSVLVPGLSNHSNDGVHAIAYWSKDHAGNSEPVKTCVLMIDTRKPTTKAPYKGTVTRGRYVKLRYRVNDLLPNGGKATVTIKVKTLGGRTVKKVTYVSKPVNTLLSWRFRCKLAKKTYRFFVYAKDRAGNTQAKVGSNRLVVR